MSDIIKFLRHEGPDFRGRMISELWEKDDAELENSHDIIQWMFPSDIPSKHHFASPVLTDEQVNTMWRDALIRESIQMSSFVFAQFLLNTRLQWIVPYNHNFLRITRVIRCMWNMRMGDDFLRWRDFSKSIYDMHPYIVGWKTLDFWMNAHNDSTFKQL